MTARYSTALSHIILAGVGIYCYLCTKGNPTVFNKTSFGLIIINSVVGVWRWGNPSYGASCTKLYGLTTLLQDYLVLPSIVSSIWLQYGYRYEIAYAFAIISFLPLILIRKNEETNKELSDTIVGVNCLSLGLLSFLHQNYFGIAACLSYAFDHFVIRDDHETFFNVTSRDLYNYAMCFFAIFSLKAVFD